MTPSESLKLAALTTAAWTVVLVASLVATAWSWLRDMAEKRRRLFAGHRYAAFRKGGAK